MARNYTVKTKILRPVADVFDAVISSEKLKRYFVNGASGNLEEGERIVSHWDHYGENTVVVRKIIKNELIELALDSKEWKKTQSEAYEVLVIFEFKQLDDGTMLSISEQGWKTDADGLKGSHDNCGGWTHMAMCLKAHIEHGIDLR
ncbi:MAG: SRPBCC domain-containing protein [Proteobacteria bacterium]|nr:SRPBCC domain-containing protein [Pseudomonadota bacterium]